MPRQRGNVRVSNLDLLNAILYVAEQGCKWRAVPQRFGPWHTIYTRMSRWARAGVLDRAFERLQHAQIVRIGIEAVSMDSTIDKRASSVRGRLIIGIVDGWLFRRIEGVAALTVHGWLPPPDYTLQFSR